MRDEIRALAEVSGDLSMVGLLNRAIEEIFHSITSQNKYPECLVLGTELAILADGIVELPVDLQHLVPTIYFLDGGLDEWGSRTQLTSFVNYRYRDSGPPFQYRIFGGPKTSTPNIYIKKLAITPFGDIVIADDQIKIDYYRKLTWAVDNTDFPIPAMEQYLILRVAARVAKTSNFRLHRNLMQQAAEAFNSLRAGALSDTPY